MAEGLHARQRASGTAVARLILAAITVVTIIILATSKKPWQITDADSFKGAVLVYSWWAGFINLLPLGILALTAKCWMRPLPASPPCLSLPALPKGFRTAVFGAMLVCAGLGALRLSHSFWDDELHIMRRCILGKYVLKDGIPKLKEVPWTNTLWCYTRPANHNLQTILSRLSLSAWRLIARPKGLPFNEAAVRMPSYLAGILSIGALTLLVARVGFPWAGVLAGWLLALHPWHLRLTPEARGYGFVMLLTPLICLLALAALENGKWKWWVALAAAEFALLYTWIPAIFLVAILNMAILISLLTEKKFQPFRGILLPRWLATQAMAGIVFLQLFLPCVPQISAYLGEVGGFFSHPFWLRNTGSLFLSGSPWSKTLRMETPYLEFFPEASSHPLLFPAVIALGLILLVLGALRLGLRNPRAAWLLPILTLPGPVMYGWAILKDKYLFEWYLAFMLPGFLALIAVGALWIISPLQRTASLRWLAPVLAVLFLAGFAFFSNPARRFLLTRSVEAYRESVLLTRPTLDPNAPENRKIITASTIHGPEIYDPWNREAKNMEQFTLLMKEADERNSPLFINNSYMGSLRVKKPDIAALLEDPAVFDLVGNLPGIEEILDRVVYRYRPGGIRHADFERYKQAVAKKDDPRFDNSYHGINPAFVY